METKTFTTNKGAKLNFSTLGFGSAPLGDLFEKLDETVAIDAVRAAYDVGMRMFDSSPHYGNGLSESRCGTAIRTMPRDEVIFSTKVGRTMNPFEPVAPKDPNVFSPGFAGGFPHKSTFDYTYDGTMRSVEQSLLRTGLAHIDILLIHDCDVWTHGTQDVDARFAEAMGGAYKALDKLRADGTVKAIGCGLNEADMCERFVRAGDFDVMLLAGRYSLLEQPALELVPAARGGEECRHHPGWGVQLRHSRHRTDQRRQVQLRRRVTGGDGQGRGNPEGLRALWGSAPPRGAALLDFPPGRGHGDSGRGQTQRS